jgi:glycosyltransferase involved in cell wall biosynthesis
MPTEKAHGFQVMKMCEAFANLGITVELWVPKRFNPIKDDPFVYYNIRKFFVFKKISVIDFIPLSKYLGKFANFVESISFSVFTMFKLKSYEADIIYTRDQFVGLFLGLLNRSFIYEVHSFPGKPFFYGRIWKKAYRIVTITAALKQKIIERGIDGGKILVASDAVDLAAFDAVKTDKEELKMELGLPKEFLVGYIGRFKTLGMEKGIKTMIEALPMLDSDIKMVFVGGEEQEIKEYKTLAGRLNVLPQCVFIGYQPYSKIIKYTKAMDVVIIPFPNKPHYAYYASPLKLFEYMASGRPIIASNLPALREILNDKNALFFKPDDANNLARAIKMIKSSQMLGYHLSQQALADVREYTWDNRARYILEFIK